MPKRSSKSRPTDPNELAAHIVKEATSEDNEREDQPMIEPPRKKNRAAVTLGRKGGKKGGPARAKKLSPERRREIAQKAAQARWAKRRQIDSQASSE